MTEGNQTFLHTDSHFWNFLYPKVDSDKSCVIYDWPLWNRGLAGSDLAYTIGLHLYPEHRQRFEHTLLDGYHQVLTGQGVDYGRDELQIDYRIGIIMGLLMPVMEFSWQVPPDDWLPKLEKALLAYEDLDCESLLS